MSKCLCCGNELLPEEIDWHKSCIKKFFGTNTLPFINIKEFSNIFLDSKNKEAVITGVQKKVSLHLERSGENSRLTFINYPSGYILKPPSSEYEQLPENEWLTMKLANLCNIETVPFGLIRLEDKTLAYITKRIDRIGKKKVDMEDFCQLGEILTEGKYKSSYEKVGKILYQFSDNTGFDYYKLFNIILFSFIVGNSDMHLNNFSLYKKNGNYILSPAYDLLNTLIITENNEELALSLEGKKREFTKDNFIYLANCYKLTELQTIRIFNKYEKSYSLLIKTINNSFLNKNLKEDYINIINDKYKRLFN